MKQTVAAEKTGPELWKGSGTQSIYVLDLGLIMLIVCVLSRVAHATAIVLSSDTNTHYRLSSFAHRHLATSTNLTQFLYWEEMDNIDSSKAALAVENGWSTDDIRIRVDATELKEYSPLATTSMSQDEVLAGPQKRGASKFAKLLHIRSSTWTAEILGTLLGLAGIAAMVAVLVAMDGKPQPHWKVHIQPNSLISIFATISSFAFMSAVTQCISQSKWLHFQKGGRVIDLQRFDRASRGPWGSLQFLARLGFRNTIAIAGSLITIASLAMGPFTQQIIEFPVRQKSLGNSSSLASAARGEGMVSGLYTNGFGNGAVAESAPDCECSNLAQSDWYME